MKYEAEKIESYEIIRGFFCNPENVKIWGNRRRPHDDYYCWRFPDYAHATPERHITSESR